MGFALGIWLAVAAWRRDLLGRNRSTGDGGPVRLGGWMILPAIGTVFLPFVAAYELAAFAPLAETAFVAGLSGWHTPAVYLEFLLAALRAPVCVTLPFLMWRRRVSFPPLFLALNWAYLGIALIFLAVVATLPSDDPKSIDKFRQALLRGGISTLIWTAYILRSQRVRATFTYERGSSEPRQPDAAGPQ